MTKPYSWDDWKEQENLGQWKARTAETKAVLELKITEQRVALAASLEELASLQELMANAASGGNAWKTHMLPASLRSSGPFEKQTEAPGHEL
jgi:hypothetical protein